MSLNVFRKHCSESKPKAAGIGLDSALTAIIGRTWENIHPAFLCVIQERTGGEEIFPQRFRPGSKVPERKGEVEKYNMSALRNMSEPDARKFVKRLYDEVTGRIEAGEQFEKVEMLEQKRGPSGTVVKRTKAGSDALAAMMKTMKN